MDWLVPEFSFFYKFNREQFHPKTDPSYYPLNVMVYCSMRSSSCISTMMSSMYHLMITVRPRDKQWQPLLHLLHMIHTLQYISAPCHCTSTTALASASSSPSHSPQINSNNLKIHIKNIDFHLKVATVFLLFSFTSINNYVGSYIV